MSVARCAWRARWHECGGALNGFFGPHRFSGIARIANIHNVIIHATLKTMRAEGQIDVEQIIDWIDWQISSTIRNNAVREECTMYDDACETLRAHCC